MNTLPPYDPNLYNSLTRTYAQYFSLSHFNVDCQQRMALVFLICFLTDKAKAKKPDTTCWTILYALNKEVDLPDEAIMGLSLVCQDFFNAGGEFPTFGLSNKEIVPKVREILKSYLPF